MSTTISDESLARVRALAARAGLRVYNEPELRALLMELASRIDTYTINGRVPHLFELHDDIERVFGIDVSARKLQARRFTQWLR